MMSSGYIEHFKSDSAAARLDARVKLVLIMCILVLVFVWKSPIYLGCLVLGIVVFSLMGGIPFSYLRKLILITLPFGIILILMHGFANRWYGETVIFGPLPEFIPLLGGHLRMYQEGTLFGLGMAFRTYALMLAMPMVISTTDMNKLVLGLIDYKVPYKITFVFTMALRFAPLLLEELRAIRDAQALRGLDTSKMTIVKRVRVSAAMVVPLILGAMNKSTQLEIALQAKAFSGSDDRTYYHSIKMVPFDWIVGGIAIFGTLFLVVARVAWGWGGFEFISVYA
jgi:energy-coupling factor transport system permease protein